MKYQKIVKAIRSQMKPGSFVHYENGRGDEPFLESRRIEDIINFIDESLYQRFWGSYHGGDKAYEKEVCFSCNSHDLHERLENPAKKMKFLIKLKIKDYKSSCVRINQI